MMKRPLQSKPEPFGQLGRGLAAAFLFVVLVGLLIWYGSTRPAILEAISPGSLEGLTPVLERVFPLTDRPPTRESWETTYMYYISWVGGIWTTIRFVQGWRFDRERLAFVPRARHRTILDAWKRLTHPRESDPRNTDLEQPKPESGLERRRQESKLERRRQESKLERRTRESGLDHTRKPGLDPDPSDDGGSDG
ncbi:hypothetical protein [Natrarchaeobius chitinivorans]|nr:hypothetical protein [Natrarchaeobius chitinivorans]